MEQLFSSFDEAWSAFLRRHAPLADFFAWLPDDEAYLTTWLALPGPAVRAASVAAQDALRDIEGVRVLPDHFLHVSLGSDVADLELARSRLRGFGHFEARFGPVNCFHDAAVLEVHSERLPELARALGRDTDFDLFLPHVSLAYFSRAPVESVRDALAALRDREPVTETIAAAHLCVVPISRSAILDPWEIAATVDLRTGVETRKPAG